MKKILLLFLTLWLGACSTSLISPTATPSPAPTPTFTPAPPTQTPKPPRDAVVTELENDIKARATSADELTPAQTGMTLSVGGGVESGEASRARVDLMPDGTIVRVGPNSSFTVTALDLENEVPKSRLELFFGNLFILLTGGSLEVNTPLGAASVRGSLMSVEYYPDTNEVIVSCLEGHCSLENELGKVDLIEGQTSRIRGLEIPRAPEPMSREQVIQWLENIPELKSFLDVLPDPGDFPEMGENINDGDKEGIINKIKDLEPGGRRPGRP